MRRVVIFLLLALVSGFVLFYNLDGSLRDWDEAVYAQVAREQLKHGEWFTLRWNNEPWIDKPPLMFWVTHLVYQFAGVGAWQARAGSAFFAWCTIMLVAVWGWRARSFMTGILSGLILLGTSHFVAIGKMAHLDLPTGFFIAASLFCFYEAKERSWLYLLSGAYTGLAILSKWTVGFFSPLVQCALLIVPVYRPALKSRYWWIGHLVTLCVCTPWFIQQGMAHGDAFWSHFMLTKTVDFMSQVVNEHSGGFFYFISMFFKKARPWGFVYIPVFCILLYRAIKKQDLFSTFLCVWIFIIWLVFSAAKTKLHWYIMPIYAPLSLGCGYVLTLLFPTKRAQGIVATVAVLIVCGHMFFSSGYASTECNESMTEFVARIEPDLSDDTIFLAYRGAFFPSLRFYTDKPVYYATDTTDFDNYLNSKHPDIIVVIGEELNELETLLKRNHVGILRKIETSKYTAIFVEYT